MIQGRMLYDIEHTARRSGSRIGRRKNQAPDARVDHRARAHRAGLQRDVQGRIEQAVAAQRVRARPQRNHLSMRGGIALADRTIPALGNDRPGMDQDGTDRHFTGGFRLAGQFQGTAHEHDVVWLHGFAFCVRGQPGPPIYSHSMVNPHLFFFKVHIL